MVKWIGFRSRGSGSRTPIRPVWNVSTMWHNPCRTEIAEESVESLCCGKQ